MCKLLSLLALATLFSCGDPAGATSATAPTRSSATIGSATATSAISIGELEGRQLESPNIRVSIVGVPMEGALLIGQFAEQ